jgi:GR25 family glycosyltransferase involved in LPS biosynthesis
MIVKSEIPVYVITLKDNPISQYYTNRIKESWFELGYINLKFVEGITPATIKDRCPIKLNFDKIRRKDKVREFTPTEKAIWYTHYYLWRRVRRLKRNAIIIEHDNMLLEEIPDSITKYDLRAFCRHDYKPCLMAGSAYYITPKGADRLINDPDLKKIIQNVDGHLLMQKDQTPFKENIYNNTHAQVIYDEKIGTTINHGKF